MFMMVDLPQPEWPRMHDELALLDAEGGILEHGQIAALSIGVDAA